MQCNHCSFVFAKLAKRAVYAQLKIDAQNHHDGPPTFLECGELYAYGSPDLSSATAAYANLSCGWHVIRKLPL
jgi:hypothetical protein